LTDFLDADPEELKKQAKPKAKQAAPERILSEEELKKREENKKRLDDMKKKREMDARRREEAAKAEEERKAEQERLLTEMKTKAGPQKKRKNRMFWESVDDLYRHNYHNMRWNKNS